MMYSAAVLAMMLPLMDLHCQDKKDKKPEEKSDKTDTDTTDTKVPKVPVKDPKVPVTVDPEGPKWTFTWTECSATCNGTRQKEFSCDGTADSCGAEPDAESERCNEEVLCPKVPECDLPKDKDDDKDDVHTDPEVYRWVLDVSKCDTTDEKSKKVGRICLRSSDNEEMEDQKCSKSYYPSTRKDPVCPKERDITNGTVLILRNFCDKDTHKKCRKMRVKCNKHSTLSSGEQEGEFEHLWELTWINGLCSPPEDFTMKDDFGPEVNTIAPKENDENDENDPKENDPKENDECKDDEDWKDTNEKDCNDYNKEDTCGLHNEATIRSWAVENGVSALEACCHCEAELDKSINDFESINNFEVDCKDDEDWMDANNNDCYYYKINESCEHNNEDTIRSWAVENGVSALEACCHCETINDTDLLKLTITDKKTVYDKIFEGLDANRDGVLSKGELALDEYNEYKFVLDHNQDGQITKDEYNEDHAHNLFLRLAGKLHFDEEDGEDVQPIYDHEKILEKKAFLTGMLRIFGQEGEQVKPFLEQQWNKMSKKNEKKISYVQFAKGYNDLISIRAHKLKVEFGDVERLQNGKFKVSCKENYGLWNHQANKIFLKYVDGKWMTSNENPLMENVHYMCNLKVANAEVVREYQDDDDLSRMHVTCQENYQLSNGKKKMVLVYIKKSWTNENEDIIDNMDALCQSTTTTTTTTEPVKPVKSSLRL